LSDELPPNSALIPQETNLIKELIQLATDGDKSAAEELLTKFVCAAKVRAFPMAGFDIPPPPHDLLINYFADCFLKIVRGESPSKALNLASGKRKRPRLNSRQKFSRFLLGARVANLMEKENVTLEVATENIREQYKNRISLSTVKNAYLAYRKMGQ
jgi:hypothetical protein